MGNTNLQHEILMSPCYTKGRGGYKITRFTPHCVVGQCTARRVGEIFQNTAKQASSTYGIGKDGDLCLIVDEENRPWTTSTGAAANRADANDYKAITVEIASGTADPYEMTEAAYRELVELAVDIGIRYGFRSFVWIPDKAKALAYEQADTECLITVHRWYAAKACPGDWLYSRLSAFAMEVTNRLKSYWAEEDRQNQGLHHTPSEWAKDAWEWAKAEGITDGTNPHGTPTREQVAAMIWRYYQKHGLS